MTVLLIVAVDAGLALAMAGAWLVQKRTHNAGWVDAIWSFSTGAAGVIFALAPSSGMAWPSPRQMLVAAAIAIWSLRLGFHLVARTRHIVREDARYARFRQEWGEGFERRMFWFLEAQAVAAMLLALAVLVAARNPAPLDFHDAIGLAVLGVALYGEAVADRQLQRFRADPAHRRGICNDGFWRWSRHPNYFFEWLAWLSYPLLALDPVSVDPWGGYDWGWGTLIAPALIYYLLVHVSGIPPLEAEMLRTRGAAYRAYQSRTRAFFPLPKPTSKPGT